MSGYIDVVGNHTGMKKVYFIIASITVFAACERSGATIYRSAFSEKPEEVEILNSLDAIIPVIDFSVWVHFKAPCEEIDRIIEGYQLREFIAVPSSGVSGVPSEWITDEDLNSCKYFERHNKETGLIEKLFVDCRNGEALYVNYRYVE